jgi:Spy/CpxP family protein refolding chaperone
MLLRGAKDLELKDAQKTKVDALAASLRPTSPGETKTELKDLQTDIAAQTKAGKLEPAKLEPKLAAIEKAGQAQKDKEAQALDDLHAALEPAERAKLVADLKAKQGQAREHRGDHGDQDGGAKKAEEWTKRRLAKMTKELDLDDAQQKKVEAILAKDAVSAKAGMPDRAEMKKQMDGALDAFEKDTFEAKKLDAFATAGKKSRAFVDHEVQFLSQLVPLLTPAQREKLSTSMSSPPKRDHERGPRGGDSESLAPLLFEDDDG